MSKVNTLLMWASLVIIVGLGAGEWYEMLLGPSWRWLGLLLGGGAGAMLHELFENSDKPKKSKTSMRRNELAKEAEK